MYQGHLHDGSSVQRHSAGGLYPFVLFGRETPRGVRWGVLTPSGQEAWPLQSYEVAAALAAEYKAASEHHPARTREPSYNNPIAPYRARAAMADTRLDDDFSAVAPFDQEMGAIDTAYCLDAPARLPMGGCSGVIGKSWVYRPGVKD